MIGFKTGGGGGGWNPHSNQPKGKAEALQLGGLGFVFEADTRTRLFNSAGCGVESCLRGKR